MLEPLDYESRRCTTAGASGSVILEHLVPRLSPQERWTRQQSAAQALSALRPPEAGP